MAQVFSKLWRESNNRRKQRKYIANAPHHIKRKFISAQLSKVLRQKYGRRSIKLRKGDKVKVMKGQHKNNIGKIESVDLKNSKIKIDTIFTAKRDGSKSFYPIHPSNVQVQEVNLDDRRRSKKIGLSNKLTNKDVKK
tara:strand:+ start:1465 stop:1875 length:411 start_codon:yes stop_codon:yes gene_type:complete